MLVLGLVLLVAVEGYLFVVREEALFRAEMQQEMLLVGDAMKGLLVDVWTTSGESRALQLIKDFNQGEHLARVHWVWLAAGVHAAHSPQLSEQDSTEIILGSKRFFDRSDPGGTKQLVWYVPVFPAGSTAGAIEVSEPLSRLEARRDRVIFRTLIVSGSIIVAGGLTVVLLGTQLIGVPLSRVMVKVRQIGKGDTSGPLQLRRSDELGELAGAVNAMCVELDESRERIRQETAARIAALERLRHADRLSTVGTMAAGVGHELGTPLNVIAARAKLIAADAQSSSETRDNVAVIRGQTERMAKLIRELLAFSRREHPHTARADLREVARRTTELLAAIARARNVTLHLAAGWYGGSCSALLPRTIRRKTRSRGNRLRLCRRNRRGTRNLSRERPPDFRAFLHHKRRRRRHGHGTFDCLRHRARSWGVDPSDD